MHLIPTEDEVIELFRKTEALREGHFEYSNGVHTNQHIEPALAMRSYENAKILTVGLSRKLRANPELRTMFPTLSIVAATPSGLPVAYGLSEVLQPQQVYWAGKEETSEPMRFPPSVKPRPGEKVILVDDILRSGQLLVEAKALIELHGAEVIALAVLIHQPTPKTVDFAPLPFYCLAHLKPRAYIDAWECALCAQKIPFDRVGRDWKSDETPEHAEALTHSFV